MTIPKTHALIIANLALLALLVISFWNAFDRTTWLMEVFPIFIALPILWSSYRKFPLTSLLYFFIFLHACVLIVGGTYTYARVPLGFDIESWLHLSRNPYDKIGHFFQGFVPALVSREILIRGNYVQGRRMLAFLVLCIVMFVSANYELIEWASALAMGNGATDFLGTQGDPWDTQSDMFSALIGGSTALILLSRWHDRLIQKLSPSHSS